MSARYGAELDGRGAADAYVEGIYRRWSDSQRARYMPIIEQQSEGAQRNPRYHNCWGRKSRQSVLHVCAEPSLRCGATESRKTPSASTSCETGHVGDLLSWEGDMRRIVGCQFLQRIGR